MPINPNSPISGLTPSQLQQLQADTANENAAGPTSNAGDYQSDRMEALRPSLNGPQGPDSLTLFQGGLHPGSGFPLGTLQTSDAYLIVPNTKGFGFSVYAPGATSINDKPVAKTFGTTLLGQNGEIIADFKNNPSVELPYGFSVTTNSSDPNSPFNGSLSFDTGTSKMQWNVVEGVQDRLSADTDKLNAATAKLATDQADLTKQQAAKNKGASTTGLGLLGVVIGPITAIAGGIAAAVGIREGSKAARKVDKDKAAVAADQAQIAGSQADSDKASQNVYEVQGTRRFMQK